MAIVGDVLRTQFHGGPRVTLGRSDASGGTEAVITGFRKVLYIICSYSEDPGDVQPVYGVDSSQTVTFTATADKQFDFMIVGLG